MDKMLIAIRRGTRRRNMVKMSLATENGRLNETESSKPSLVGQVAQALNTHKIHTQNLYYSQTAIECGSTPSDLVRRRQTNSRPVSQAVS